MLTKSSIEQITEHNPIQNSINCVCRKSLNGTKMNSYVNILNTSLNVHPVYTTNIFIPDYHRESFTRLRLMSHNLKIETGRCRSMESNSTRTSCVSMRPYSDPN